MWSRPNAWKRRSICEQEILYDRECEDEKYFSMTDRVSLLTPRNIDRLITWHVDDKIDSRSFNAFWFWLIILTGWWNAHCKTKDVFWPVVPNVFKKAFYFFFQCADPFPGSEIAKQFCTPFFNENHPFYKKNHQVENRPTVKNCRRIILRLNLLMFFRNWNEPFSLIFLIHSLFFIRNLVNVPALGR